LVVLAMVGDRDGGCAAGVGGRLCCRGVRWVGCRGMVVLGLSRARGEVAIAGGMTLVDDGGRRNASCRVGDDPRSDGEGAVLPDGTIWG